VYLVLHLLILFDLDLIVIVLECINVLADFFLLAVDLRLQFDEFAFQLEIFVLFLPDLASQAISDPLVT